MRDRAIHKNRDFLIFKIKIIVSQLKFEEKRIIRTQRGELIVYEIILTIFFFNFVYIH